MKMLKNDQVFFAFAPTQKSVMSVPQNELFSLETLDCYGNQLHADSDTIDGLDWDNTNPATGPVRIEGVKAGDIVKIDIDQLVLAGDSVMATIPGFGAISGITDSETRIMSNRNGTLFVSTDLGELELASRPMIGVIGFAPAEGSIANGVPGKHGGNMDCSLIGEGSSLYLHAEVDGGLFGCGDVHALMGDGEVAVCGAETPARVTLQTTVIDIPDLPTPFLETNELYVTIASAKTVEAAYQQAIDNMFTFLTRIAGLGNGDAARLMGLVGNLRFCQVVDPEITIRFEFPKDVLDRLGFHGIDGGK